MRERHSNTGKRMSVSNDRVHVCTLLWTSPLSMNWRIALTIALTYPVHNHTGFFFWKTQGALKQEEDEGLRHEGKKMGALTGLFVLWAGALWDSLW